MECAYLRVKKKKLLFFFISIIYDLHLFSQGIVLSPHRSVYVEVELGTKTAAVKYGEPLYVENKGLVPLRILVDVKKTSDFKRKPLFGYSEIPDVNFIKPFEFEVPPNSKRPIPLNFNIPDNDEYYNRKWEALLIVRGASGNIGIELMGQVFVETKGKVVNKNFNEAKYKEEFFLTPATLIFDSFKDEKSLYIHNTSTSPLTFLIVSESPPMAVVEMFIPLSVGYERLEDEEWVEPIIYGEEKIRRIKKGKEIQPQKKITLQPGEIKEMKVRINIPSKKEFKGKKFESYIFVRSPLYDKTKFVRLRIDKN